MARAPSPAREARARRKRRGGTTAPESVISVASCSDVGPILEQTPHGGLEFLEIHWLGQVGIEAGVLCALDIFLHAEAGERDGRRLAGFSYFSDQIHAGAIGQTKVAEKKIELLALDSFQRGGDTWSD